MTFAYENNLFEIEICIEFRISGIAFVSFFRRHRRRHIAIAIEAPVKPTKEKKCEFIIMTIKHVLKPNFEKS